LNISNGSLPVPRLVTSTNPLTRRAGCQQQLSFLSNFVSLLGNATQIFGLLHINRELLAVELARGGPWPPHAAFSGGGVQNWSPDTFFGKLWVEYYP